MKQRGAIALSKKCYAHNFLNNYCVYCPHWLKSGGCVDMYFFQLGRCQMPVVYFIHRLQIELKYNFFAWLCSCMGGRRDIKILKKTSSTQNIQAPSWQIWSLTVIAVIEILPLIQTVRRIERWTWLNRLGLWSRARIYILYGVFYAFFCLLDEFCT